MERYENASAPIQEHVGLEEEMAHVGVPVVVEFLVVMFFTVFYGSSVQLDNQGLRTNSARAIQVATMKTIWWLVTSSMVTVNVGGSCGC